MKKPYTPADVIYNRRPVIPDVVIDAVNELLVESCGTDRIVLSEKAIICRIQSKVDITSAAIYSKRWLEFESVYHEHGWSVQCTRPEQTFLFIALHW